MMGKISTYLYIPLICIIIIISFGAFYTGNSVPTSLNPNPSYNTPQTYIGINFFNSVDGFVTNINDLGAAVQLIAPAGSTLDIGGLAIASAGAGVAVVKVFLGIPMLIVAFIYDIVRLVFFFLPAVAPPELMVVIGIATLIPIIAIIFEIAGALRPPGLAKW